MLKKILFLLLCATATLCSAEESKIKIKQVTPEDTLETFFTAIVERDSEAMWNILDPALREILIKNSGDETMAKQAHWENFLKNWNPKQDESFKKILNDPARKKEFLSRTAKKIQKKLIKKDGLFYLNPVTKTEKKTIENESTTNSTLSE